MLIRSSRFAFVVVCLWLTGSAFGRAQEKGTDASSSSEQSPSKKQRKKLAKELASPYDVWLANEVPDIITDDERRAFQSLSTNEEREQFIEQFWDRRNSDPESPVNTMREEHYRRLAYADEHFSSGIPGRKTDRGHIYILWGPPDEIESHPTGGTYDRPMQQGGGQTQTYPWEKWRYRYLDGIGENIEIEFVDPSGTGEYHITSDPCEKDASSHVPGAGPSLSEMLGLSTRASRFSNSNGTTCPAPLGGVSASGDEFENLDRYFRVQRAPQHLTDLAEKVTSRIVANQLPFQYRADFLRVTSSTTLVPITIEFRNRDVSFQGKAGVASAALELYGRITSPGGRVVQTFEEVISRDIPESLLAKSGDHVSIYQKALPLRPGLYRIDIVVKDRQSGNVGTLAEALRVPAFDEQNLDASSLILADQIERVPPRQAGGGQFVLDSFKVRPRLDRDLSGADKLGIYLQFYNLTLDEATHRSKVSVAYRITQNQKEVWHQVETSEQLDQGREQLTIARFIPVSSLPPGRYVVEVTGIDQLSNKTVTRTAEFEIKATEKSKDKAPAGL